MTLAQIEQRLVALETAVQQLQARTPQPDEVAESARAQTPAAQSAEIVPGAEYPLVPAVPPTEVTRLRGILKRVEPGPAGLALSQAEWESLDLEEAHE